MYRRSYAKLTCAPFMGSSTKPIFFIFLVSACVSFAFLYIPIRNVVFRYYIYKAWRNVSTPDLIKMHYIRPQHPPGVFATVECDVLEPPVVKRESINTSGILVYKASYDKEIMFTALSKGHGRYLPFLKMERKLDYLYLFMTAKEAFQKRNIIFFMTAGSILGATRHGGFVPWDDDLDLGIHMSHWEDVKQLLSCIKGFTLEIFAPFHWKFHFKDRSFPFIDIFFYSKHEHYLWSLTHYISKTFIYPEHLVFPLTEVEFEGTRMPIPRKGLDIIKMIYDDYTQCVAYPGHVKLNKTGTDIYPEGYSKSHVPCRDLQYMYTMKNL